LALGGDLVEAPHDDLADASRPLIAARPFPDRDGVLGRLAVAHHEHVGTLLQLSLTNLIPNLSLPLVERGAETRPDQAVADRRGVREVAVRDWQHNRLDRREPERKGPG